MDAEVIIVIGANPTVNHPVAATFIKNAAKRGAKLIVIDPRRQTLSRHAYCICAFKPGSDVALLNAMLNTIITEGLTDEQYIAGYTEGFDELKAQDQGLHAGEDGADLRHRRRDHPRSGADYARRAPRSSSGAWASASMSTAPTMRAA